MLWDPSVLGPTHPETCPGWDPQGRNPLPRGSCRQELRVTHRGWGQTLHTSGVSRGGRKNQVEEETFFCRSPVSMAPSREVLLHGPAASWGLAVRRGDPGVSLHHGHANPGHPQPEGAQMEDAA